MSRHFHELRTEELSATIGDHAAHGRHEPDYSGIWQLHSRHESRPLFIPEYCGFNFEFIAPVDEENIFEPRWHPSELLVEQAGRAVAIHQSPTPSHKVESWLEFKTAGPSHIDWCFRYRLEDPGLFAGGLAGFFFASYIDRPENKAIYLLSRDVYDALMWAQFCTVFQGHRAAVTWEEDAYDYEFGPRDHGLYSSRAPIRYHLPLFYGRQDDMVLAVLFERPQGVVICHGMGGGGYVEDRSDRNPAWDFFLYTSAASSHAEGAWRGRLLYKPFAGRHDILHEYRRMMADFGHQWEIPAYGPAGGRD